MFVTPSQLLYILKFSSISSCIFPSSSWQHHFVREHSDGDVLWLDQNNHTPTSWPVITTKSILCGQRSRGIPSPFQMKATSWRGVHCWFVVSANVGSLCEFVWPFVDVDFPGNHRGVVVGLCLWICTRGHPLWLYPQHLVVGICDGMLFHDEAVIFQDAESQAFSETLKDWAFSPWRGCRVQSETCCDVIRWLRLDTVIWCLNLQWVN